MPVYEYICQKCSHPFEELVSDGAQPLCPACSAPEVERVLSVVSVGQSSSNARAESPCGRCGGAEGGGCPFN